jgi:hypothetical protein
MKLINKYTLKKRNINRKSKKYMAGTQPSYKLLEWILPHKNKLQLKELSSNPMAMDLLEEHPDMLNLEGLCKNVNDKAVRLLNTKYKEEVINNSRNVNMLCSNLNPHAFLIIKPYIQDLIDLQIKELEYNKIALKIIFDNKPLNEQYVKSNAELQKKLKLKRQTEEIKQRIQELEEELKNVKEGREQLDLLKQENNKHIEEINRQKNELPMPIKILPWAKIAENPNPEVVDIILNKPDKTGIISNLALNPNPNIFNLYLTLITKDYYDSGHGKYYKLAINWINIAKNPLDEAVEFIIQSINDRKVNKSDIIRYLCGNPNSKAIQLCLENIDITNNYEIIELCKNSHPDAIQYLKTKFGPNLNGNGTVNGGLPYTNREAWKNLAGNINQDIIQIIEQNMNQLIEHRVDIWGELSANPSIFNYDYKKIKTAHYKSGIPEGVAQTIFRPYQKSLIKKTQSHIIKHNLQKKSHIERDFDKKMEDLGLDEGNELRDQSDVNWELYEELTRTSSPSKRYKVTK